MYGTKIKPVVSAFIRYHIQMIILIKKQVMIFFLLEITPNLPKKMKFKLKKNHNLVSLKDKNILFASINSWRLGLYFDTIWGVFIQNQASKKIMNEAICGI